jgi:hypothetical protein
MSGHRKLDNIGVLTASNLVFNQRVGCKALSEKDDVEHGWLSISVLMAHTP